MLFLSWCNDMKTVTVAVPRPRNPYARLVREAPYRMRVVANKRAWDRKRDRAALRRELTE